MSKSKSLKSLIQRIDDFIRLFYKNLIIRGLIYSAALILILFLVVNLLEYFNYFGRTTRTVLFFGYIIAAVTIIGVYIIDPLLRLYKIGKRISYEQAAKIISTHFPDVSDKLLNTLQLGSMVNETEQIGMLEAAIAQKTEKIKNIPFTEAIDKKENLRKIPYAILPLVVLMLVLLSAPSVIKDPAIRISRYNMEFERPMPFSFQIDKAGLRAIRGQDLDLIIIIEGKELPGEVFVEYQNKTVRAAKTSGNAFIYRFRNLNHDLSFRLQAGGFHSEKYNIEVIPKPAIINYTVHLNHPEYTKMQDEQLNNTGDLTVPEGTTATWKFYTRDADTIYWKTGTSKRKILDRTEQSFTNSLRTLESFDYAIIPQNQYNVLGDSMVHRVEVIPDLYPEIQVETFIDSSDFRVAYFTGQIRDDYGFSKLKFHYTLRNARAPEEIIDSKSIRLPIDLSLTNQSFFHSIDFTELDMKPGDRVEYWFEVWDNDGVNGSKSTRSGTGSIELPGIREMEREIAERQDEMFSEMSNLQRSLHELTREINQLQRSILQKESISWEDTNKLQEMLERQQRLQQRIDMLKDDNTALNKMQQEINPYNEEILRKQNELQKLFDELMTDEMKKLFEELQKMLEDVDRSKMQELLKQMEMSNEELLKDLDRNLELFKQLEMEKLLTDAITKLEMLAVEQEKLADDTGNAENEDSINLEERQEELNAEFEKMKEDLKKIEEKNQELQWKYEMIDLDEMSEGIDELLQQSLDQLQQNNRERAVPSQQDAARQMQEMSQSLMSMMEQAHQEQLGEDIRMLRKLLEDLVDISFDQEDLIERTVSINRIDPRFNDLLSEQKRINVSLKQVEDSLTALAKRQIAIQQFVLREIAQINNNVEETIKTLEERNVRAAGSRQQYVMTSVNNLALMLSEAMDQMMQQMLSSSMDGDACPMSGQGQGGKPSMRSMKDLQQQLNQQMQQMQQSLGKPDEEGMPQPGGQSMSEQFARMAAQQEALRRQMQQYLEELRSETGTSDGNLTKAIEEIEQTEKDLVHKRITNETLMRQERIMTRLLESERAEMEREKKEERESRTAQDYQRNDPDSILEIYRRKMNEREMLRTVPPQLNPFYRTKVNDYFIQVQ